MAIEKETSSKTEDTLDLVGVKIHPFMRTEWFSMRWCPTCQLYKSGMIKVNDAFNVYECPEGHLIQSETKDRDGD